MAENSLLEKVLGLQEKYISLQEQLSDPAVISDMKKYVQLNKEYKELAPIIKAGNEYRKLLEDYDAAKSILAEEKDEELREMAKEEMAEIEPKLPQMEQDIKLLLIPADPQDGKNAILEIRGGTGGDEAAIFAGDLLRMYSKYCERRGWKMEITNQSEGAASDHVQKSHDNSLGACAAEYGRDIGYRADLRLLVGLIARHNRIPVRQFLGKYHLEASGNPHPPHPLAHHMGERTVV